MAAETLDKGALTPSMGGSGDGGEGIRPTANYDDEPERDNDPTGMLTRVHTERYGASAAARFVGVSPDAIAHAIRTRKAIEGDPGRN